MLQLHTDKIREIVAQRRIPCATYRLQFSQKFTFRDAEALVPYLHSLGISDVYASPLLKAMPGSTHGYDICDHSQLNPELGSADDFRRFRAALQMHGMGLLIDIVPNHMGIGSTCNRWWTDVLENGPSSTYAHYFDIDWNPVKPELANKVLLPVLEDQYGNVLESGKLELVCREGSFQIVYGSHEWPIAPRTYAQILSAAADRIGDTGEQEDIDAVELQSIITALSYLPSRIERDEEKLVERQREKEVIKRRLATLLESSAVVREAIETTVQVFNGTPGDPRSFDALDQLIESQPYRLAFWRVAGDEINYRRFFDINTMAALRTELPHVFHATHDLIFQMLESGDVTGLRVDHPDGLWDPKAYFRQLQEGYVSARLRATDDGSADGLIRDDEVKQWLEQHEKDDGYCWPVYVVAEKILTENEPLPSDWPVYGTTGYDYLNLANGLFVDASHEAEFNALYERFAGAAPRFRDLEYAMKQMIMQDALASELNALAHRLERIDEKNRHYRDFTLNGLERALREVMACLSIYRTYVTGPDAVSARDQRFIEAAVREAKNRNPRTSQTIFNFIRDTLLLRNLSDFSEADRPEIIEFAMKFQQISGPVMAKSVEDTSFYIYNRLVSLNEVGGTPDQFGLSLEVFHAQNVKRQEQWPHTMLSSTTHDTKRSEDLRARLNVLSEMPDEWERAIEMWREMNGDKKTSIDDMLAPDANDEYLFYQSIVGTWPFGVESAEAGKDWADYCQRLSGYMAKATKEAKVHTSWTNANDAYDRAVGEFVSTVLDPSNKPFIEAFVPFHQRAAHYGVFNSLSQTLLKFTCPGVPDIYRGTELWDFSLVDPDNRRPVDYERCQALLDDLKKRAEAPGYDCGELADELLRESQDGRIKLYLVRTMLTFRANHEQHFNDGHYEPLVVEGAKQSHACAFSRTLGGDMVITVVPRLVVGLTDGQERAPIGADVWQDTTLVLPPEQVGEVYRNLFTGDVLVVQPHNGKGRLALGDVLNRFPVAVLTQFLG
jgi:(1->4)-alpha-D-glucan 1-alpha-D-glucosylmutase